MPVSTLCRPVTTSYSCSAIWELNHALLASMVSIDTGSDDVDLQTNEEQQPLLEGDSTDMENLATTSKAEKGLASSLRRSNSLQPSVSQHSDVQVGIENLSKTTPPHESYEGVHRWDPLATWTPEEEAALVRKTDFYLLTWVCLMVRNHETPGNSTALIKLAAVLRPAA